MSYLLFLIQWKHLGASRRLNLSLAPRRLSRMSPFNSGPGSDAHIADYDALFIVSLAWLNYFANPLETINSSSASRYLTRALWVESRLREYQCQYQCQCHNGVGRITDVEAKTKDAGCRNVTNNTSYIFKERYIIYCTDFRFKRMSDKFIADKETPESKFKPPFVVYYYWEPSNYNFNYQSESTFVILFHTRNIDSHNRLTARKCIIVIDYVLKRGL